MLSTLLNQIKLVYGLFGQNNMKSTIYNIIHWFAGPMGQMTGQQSHWCSKYFFSFILSYILRALKTLYLHFCTNETTKWKGFCKEFWEILWKQKNNMYLQHQTLGRKVIVPSATRTSVLYFELADSKYVSLQKRSSEHIVLSYILW